MRIGVVFPQTEIGADVGAVRAYAERVEELGYAHLLAYDHVLGADPESTSLGRPVRRRHDVPRAVRAVRLPRRASRSSSSSPASSSSRSARPRSSRSRPPRSTSSRGASSGSASVSVGTPSSTRRSAPTSRPRPADGRAGRVAAPPVDRASVTHDGAYEHVTGAGLAPLPVQRPIPVWFGAASAPAFGAPVGSPTVGSRWSRPAHGSTRRARSSRRPPPRPGATRRRSAWRAVCRGRRRPALTPRADHVLAVAWHRREPSRDQHDARGVCRRWTTTSPRACRRSRRRST